MKNIFASDIDGTLTDFSLPSLDSFGIKALNRASGLGEIVLASARPFKGIVSMYSENDLKVNHIVALNGGHIISNNKTFKTYPVSNEVVQYFIENEHFFPNLWFYTEDSWYASDLQSEEYKKEVYAVNFKASPIKDYKKEEVLKILVVSEINKDEILNNLINKFENITITTSSDSYIEIFSSEINKFLAIKTLFLGEESSRIFSFGDSNNDYEMIKNSFLGCAVNNATPKVKSVAKYISKYNFGEGVYDCVKYIEENIDF